MELRQEEPGGARGSQAHPSPFFEGQLMRAPLKLLSSSMELREIGFSTALSEKLFPADCSSYFRVPWNSKKLASAQPSLKRFSRLIAWPVDSRRSQEEPGRARRRSQE